MKKPILLLLSLLLIVNVSLQAQGWTNGGNTLSGNGTLGTNSNHSLIFETYNKERGRITNTGLWGIGTGTTITPNAKLHINSLSTEDPLRVQVNGITKLFLHRSGGVSVGASSTPPVNGLYVSGNVGIGTATPEHKLHVVGNEILSTGLLSGFRFRNRGSVSNFDDWVWYSQDNLARFWRAGAGDLMGITTSGNVGIGTTDPGNYKLKIVHGSDGLNLENASSGNDWELYVIGGDNRLTLNYNSIFKGSFDPFSGAYSSISDERLKTNIKAIPSVLDKVNQLKPAAYHFKTTENAPGNIPESFGFLAQDVMKIFPQLVTHHVNKERNLDTYTMDYSGFGVIAIKAIQEQKQLIEQLQQENNMFKERLNKLEAAINAGKNGFNSLPNGELMGIDLEQNQPNPFNQNTTFKYRIPTDAKAQILIYDPAGKLVKTLTAPSNGLVQMDTKGMAPGNYVYSLTVNGKVAISKQMILY